MTPDEVRDARFAATKFRSGYDQEAVDDFLDRVVEALTDRDAGRQPRLTAADIDAVVFPPVKFREGYDLDEVDDFLDRVRAELAGGPVQAPAEDPGAADVVDEPAPGIGADAPIPGMLPERRGLFGRRR